MKPTTVMLVDDHAVVRTGFRLLLQAADMAGTQARNVGYQSCLSGLHRQVMRIGFKIDRRNVALVAFSDFPWQIIVAVDQRRLCQDLLDAVLIRLCSPGAKGKT